MDEQLGVMRDIVMDHVLHQWNIETTSGYVCGDEHRVGLRLETAQGLETLALLHLAVKSVGGHTN
jgi:hypothetical protein